MDNNGQTNGNTGEETNGHDTSPSSTSVASVIIIFYQCGKCHPYLESTSVASVIIILNPVWQVSSSYSTSVASVIIILNPEIAASSSSHQDVPTTTRLPSCPRHQNGVIQVSSPSSYLSEWCRRRRHICHQNKKFRSRQLTWCRLQQASMGCQTEDLGARPPPKYTKVIISGIHCHHRRYNSLKNIQFPQA